MPPSRAPSHTSGMRANCRFHSDLLQPVVPNNGDVEDEGVLEWKLERGKDPFKSSPRFTSWFVDVLAGVD